MDKGRRVSELGAARDCAQRAISRARDYDLRLPVSGVTEACQYVPLRQVGEVLQNILMRHTGREVRKHILHGNSHAPDCGLPTALTRLDGNYVLVVCAHFNPA